MTIPLHRDQTEDNGVHRPTRWTYADESDRENHLPVAGPRIDPLDLSSAFKPLSAIDVGNFARQLDDDTIHLLLTTTPTWKLVGFAAHDIDGADHIFPGGTVNFLREDGAFAIPPISAASVFAQLSSSVDQIPTDLNPTVITYNSQDAIQGITHSVSVDPGEIEIDVDGSYFIMAQPQVGKDSGGVEVDFDLFLQVNRVGGGFTDEPNSNVKITIKDANNTDVLISGLIVQLNDGDKVRMMQKVQATGSGIGLKATAAVVGPPTVPATPSIIFTMFRAGNF